MRTLIKRVSAYLGERNCFQLVDLLIEDGRFVEIKPEINDKSARVIQCELKNHITLPGFIDLHCHLREPGQTHKETIKTGTMAAAKGGYTRLVAMGNTNPTMSSVSIYEDMIAIIKRDAIIPVIQAGTITQDLKGKVLSEVFLKNQCQIYSDDGKGIQDRDIMIQAVEQAKKNNSILILHEEMESVPNDEAESSMVERDIKIAIEKQYPLHFTHLSSKKTIQILQAYKRWRKYFTADTTPHHLFFSEYDLIEDDTAYKVNPPILSKDDQRALVKAIQFSFINSIATDHAPHSKEEKNQPFASAPCGISGFETAFPACFTKYIDTPYLSIRTLIHLFSKNPAKILGIYQDEGSIEVGKKANLVVIDRKMAKKVTEAQLVSKGKNTPFIGKYLSGWPILTILEGEIVYEENSSRLNS